MKILNYYYALQARSLPLISFFEDGLNMLARLYLAKIFFLSGLTKLRDWDSTLFLFQEEYHVPLIPPELAAYLGAGGELLLPILLIFGFVSRFSATGLFIVNAVAVLSLTDISDTALIQHTLWGILLVYLIMHGGKRLSVDYFLEKYSKIRQQ